MALFVGAMLGSALGLYFKMFEEWVYSPKLDVSSKHPQISDLHLQMLSPALEGDSSMVSLTSKIIPAEYHCNRLLIKNRGLRAAEGCKADLKLGDELLRLCWSHPKERPFATINAESEESLDVCAVLSRSDSMPKRIAPNSDGWDNFVNLDKKSLETIEGSLIISARNADPKMIKIQLLKFENALSGRIILVVL